MSRASWTNSKTDPQARRLTASVLDRLLLVDEGQQKQLDEYDVEALRRDVRSSLETLLNSRRPPGELPPPLKELADSVYHYGIPDFTEIGFGGIEQLRAICQQVEAAIARFEPRLMGVRVELNEQGNYDHDRILRFRIRARLQARPRPQEVVYDSVVDRTTYNFEVRSS